MSMYNMVNGVNQSTFFILPMLGKHPDTYPRFRDCYLNESNQIVVRTRTGGGNRSEYEDENAVLQSDPNYISDSDCDWDRTYAEFVFKVPDQFKDDFDKIVNGKLLEISQDYKDKMYEVYPKLKEKFDKIFNK